MSRAFYCLGHATIIRSTRVPMRLIPRCQFSALTTTKTTQIITEQQTASRYSHIGLIKALNYVNSSRNIFTERAIGMERFNILRERNGSQFEGEARERFIKRTMDLVNSANFKLIFKDDMINMIAVADKDEHLDLIEKIVTESEGEQAIFFRGWGAAVMRLYYKLGKWERAERNMRDTARFGEFFNMRTCYKILMTMLYDAGHYEKVWDIFQFSKERGIVLVRPFNGNPNEMYLDRNLASNVFAALARIQEPSAFERAKKLWEEVYIAPKSVGLRLSSFMAYIAYKNDDYAYAMNVISGVNFGNYVSLRDLNMLCLMKGGRFEEVSARLREYRAEAKLSGRNYILRSTYDALNEIKANIQEQYLRNEFDDIMIEIEAGQLIQDDTLENITFRQMDLIVRTDPESSNRGDERRPYQNRDMGGQISRLRQDNRRGPRREFVQRGERYDRVQHDDDASPRYNNNNNYRQDNRRSYQDDQDADMEDDLEERPAPRRRGERNRFSHQNKLFE